MGTQKQQQQNHRTAIVIITLISYLCLLAIPFLFLWRMPQYSQGAFSNTVMEQVTVKNIYAWKSRGVYLETEDGREFSFGGLNFSIKQKTGWDFLELEPTLSGQTVTLEYLADARFLVWLRMGDTEYDLTAVAEGACAEQRLGIYACSILAVLLSIGSTYCCWQEFHRPSKKKKKQKKTK